MTLVAFRCIPIREHRTLTPPVQDRVRIDEAAEEYGAPIPLGALAARVALSTLVVLGIAAGVATVWAGRLVVALLFFAIIIASAIRPGVDALKRRRVPRGIGVLLHYSVLVGLLAGALWLVVPAATDQVQSALGPEHGLREEAQTSTGIRHDVLIALDRRLNDVPSGSKLLDPALDDGRTAFEVLIGAFFVFATAAYWTLERERAVDLVCSILPRPKRKTVRDTWEPIDLRLGAFVRGQSVLIAIVATMLSVGFWAIGLPYWLLVGVFAGLVEIVPVIGPLIAGVVAIGVGLSVSTHLAVVAGLLVLGVRLVEDYLIIPRVLGHSVGRSPLVVLVSVTLVGVVFGGFAVIIAVPPASVLVTLVDVIVRDKRPRGRRGADSDLPCPGRGVRLTRLTSRDGLRLGAVVRAVSDPVAWLVLNLVVRAVGDLGAIRVVVPIVRAIGDFRARIVRHAVVRSVSNLRTLVFVALVGSVGRHGRSYPHKPDIKQAGQTC